MLNSTHKASWTYWTLPPQSHNEYIHRAGLVQTAAKSPEIKQSPNVSKARRQTRKAQQQPPDDQPPQIPIPKSAVTDMGVTNAIQQFLEVSCCLAFAWKMLTSSAYRLREYLNNGPFNARSLAKTKHESAEVLAQTCASYSIRKCNNIHNRMHNSTRPCTIPAN